jgi:hypothetical protein
VLRGLTTAVNLAALTGAGAPCSARKRPGSDPKAVIQEAQAIAAEDGRTNRQMG